MLRYNGSYCLDCIENSICEFSFEYCPKAIFDQNLAQDIADDPSLKKYREYYQRSR